MQQAIIWASVDLDLCRHIASLGHNELIPDMHCILWTQWTAMAMVKYEPMSIYGRINTALWITSANTENLQLLTLTAYRESRFLEECLSTFHHIDKIW